MHSGLLWVYFGSHIFALYFILHDGNPSGSIFDSKEAWSVPIEPLGLGGGYFGASQPSHHGGDPEAI